ncbi:TVP38/TMEM64 family protein [Pseudodesulfovibrio pelocollis]|uniref:TVP38/TMEM64 family protein n=1 Tax=Pseudodesulfovibrio pelocollis TaxID=3051432 RepID=UPI00255B181A|nr:TVP38/TMEM64 family protein [Pseudodesulfovibrio sp. SB368]
MLIMVARALELDQILGSFKEWVGSQGVMGPVIFAGVYAVATVLALPGVLLTIMAGAVFGSVVGVLTAIVGATVGASLCFLISRYLARESITFLLNKNEKFRRLDDLTEKNGAIIVAITRLVPLFPFNLLNYGFGLTKVPFRTYVLWSALCMLPGTILYVVGTDAIATAMRDGQIPVSLVAVVALIAVILTLVVRKAKSALKE